MNNKPDWLDTPFPCNLQNYERLCKELVRMEANYIRNPTEFDLHYYHSLAVMLAKVKMINPRL